MVRRGVRRGRAVGGPALLALALGGLVAPTVPASADKPDPALHVVTFSGTGTAGYSGPLDLSRYRAALTREQNEALARVDVPAPTYRWTAALSGVAVSLTPEQAETLRGLPQVTQVEESTVRPLAARPRAASGAVVPGGRGGRGVVVGVVDTGVWPESPLFAAAPGTGRGTSGFRGTCAPGEGWDDDTCSTKLVGARWFVHGFGARPGLLGRGALRTRRPRSRHPGRLRRRRQLRRVHRPEGAAAALLRRRAGRPARRLQGVLERARPR